LPTWTDKTPPGFKYYKSIIGGETLGLTLNATNSKAIHDSRPPTKKKKLVVNGRKLLFEETFCDGEIYVHTVSKGSYTCLTF